MAGVLAQAIKENANLWLPVRKARPEGRDAAKEARLRYVSDTSPGIRRHRAGKGFRYTAPDGSAVRDPETRQRIQALVIPPAWTDVWICPHPNGHVQATGRDERGRKQYRYHDRWREVRDGAKFERLAAFGEALPGIRERVERDLARPGLPREKVLAAVVRLLETTFIRVGNEEYARENESYGLTTLRNEHVEVQGTAVRFHFRAKSGKFCETGIRDRRLARLVKRCQELPGQDLFQYLGEDGEPHGISSADVNEYLHRVTGQDFTAKEFRTWAGTVLAFVALRECEACESAAQAKRNVSAAIKQVAARLNNTPAVCRKCYVHPAVLETYLDSSIRSHLQGCSSAPLKGLAGDEAAVLRFFFQRASTA
jgi:DNA topoisomerase I